MASSTFIRLVQTLALGVVVGVVAACASVTPPAGSAAPSAGSAAPTVGSAAPSASSAASAGTSIAPPPTSVAPTTPATPASSPDELEPPTSVVNFRSGTAEVTTTGDVAATLDLTIDESLGSGRWGPAGDGTGELELYFEDSAGDRLVLGLDIASTVTDAFVAVGAPGRNIDDPTYFSDFLHTDCTVVLDHFDENGLGGSFSCSGIANGAGDQTIDATGTFSAAP